MTTPQQPPVAGYIIALVAALAFAAQNAFAGLSLEGGAAPLTLVTVRTVFTLCILAALLKITGGELTLPRRDRYAAMGLGILNGIMAFCLMSSFDHIAVGLTILIFYLYPVLTGILSWATGLDRLDRGVVLGLIGGFAGLSLALEFSGDAESALGMALAGAAAVMMAVTIVLSTRVLRSDNSRTVTLYMHVSSASMFVILFAATGDTSLPATSEGWTGAVGVLIFYTVAITTFFASIARIGGVRTSLVMNIEPIASIGLGFALLGQALTPRQLVGAAIVLAAVTAVKWLKGKPR